MTWKNLKIITKITKREQLRKNGSTLIKSTPFQSQNQSPTKKLYKHHPKVKKNPTRTELKETTTTIIEIEIITTITTETDIIITVLTATIRSIIIKMNNIGTNTMITIERIVGIMMITGIGKGIIGIVGTMIISTMITIGDEAEEIATTSLML